MKTKKKFTESQREKLLQWADWLETTDLAQGRGSLRNQKSEYCCLGVYLTCKYPERKWKLSLNPYIKNDGIFAYMYGRNNTENELYALPLNEQRLLGLSDTGDSIICVSDFITMNDELLYSFQQIAAEIRYIVEHETLTDETRKQMTKCVDEDN